MGKYVIKDFEDVFSPEFVEFLKGAPDEKSTLNQIMQRVERLEEKNELEFVAFFGAELIIFKQLS